MDYSINRGLKNNIAVIGRGILIKDTELLKNIIDNNNGKKIMLITTHEGIIYII